MQVVAARRRPAAQLVDRDPASARRRRRRSRPSSAGVDEVRRWEGADEEVGGRHDEPVAVERREIEELAAAETGAVAQVVGVGIEQAPPRAGFARERQDREEIVAAARGRALSGRGRVVIAPSAEPGGKRRERAEAERAGDEAPAAEPLAGAARVVRHARPELHSPFQSRQSGATLPERFRGGGGLERRAALCHDPPHRVVGVKTYPARSRRWVGIAGTAANAHPHESRGLSQVGEAGA